MPVKRRVIWLTDDQWAKAQQRARAFDLNVSGYVAKLIEWRQPDPGVMATASQPQTDSDGRWVPEFRPVPKPGKR